MPVKWQSLQKLWSLHLEGGEKGEGTPKKLTRWGKPEVTTRHTRMPDLEKGVILNQGKDQDN